MTHCFTDRNGACTRCWWHKPMGYDVTGHVCTPTSIEWQKESSKTSELEVAVRRNMLPGSWQSSTELSVCSDDHEPGGVLSPAKHSSRQPSIRREMCLYTIHLCCRTAWRRKSLSAARCRQARGRSSQRTTSRKLWCPTACRLVRPTWCRASSPAALASAHLSPLSHTQWVASPEDTLCLRCHSKLQYVAFACRCHVYSSVMCCAHGMSFASILHTTP